MSTQPGDVDPGHMSPAELREHGHAIVDWVADYLEGLEDRPVRSQVEPGEVRAALPDHPPQQGEYSLDGVVADLDETIVPGLTHWQHPSFFGFFPANSSGPAILGELLSAGLGVQGMVWESSPAATELESLVLDWLAELLGLPEGFRSSGPGGGVIQDSASSATLCALLAAAERATDGAASQAGIDRKLTVYASTQAHSSVEKAVRIAGLGAGALRLIDVDERYAMRPDALAAAVDADRAEGSVPCLVVATTGTTSSLAFDPLSQIGRIARDAGAWLHVDAAAAGVAAVAPEHRSIHDGLGFADSYCTNPHKWLLTNFDCDAFYVADRGPLVRALSVLPEYLRTAASDAGQVVDYRDWQVPLGRRFRALKLWMVIRWYGAEGLRAHIRRHCAWARWLADQVEGHPDLDLAAPPALNLVCFGHAAGDEASAAMLRSLNDSGAMYLTRTQLGGRTVLRLCIGAPRTEQRHVEDAWTRIAAAATDAKEHP